MEETFLTSGERGIKTSKPTPKGFSLTSLSQGWVTKNHSMPWRALGLEEGCPSQNAASAHRHGSVTSGTYPLQPWLLKAWAQSTSCCSACGEEFITASYCRRGSVESPAVPPAQGSPKVKCV